MSKKVASSGSSDRGTKVADIDWSTWKPEEEATLLFVMSDDRVLLIHKKRGLGAGKINGPGGRIEPGETPMQCAIREVQEEIRVTSLDVSYVGQLNFQFTNGYSIRGEVFRAERFEGVPEETDEAVPEWFPADALPYDRMWEDDPIWVPEMLAGNRFVGRFVFDEDTMLDHEFLTGDRLPSYCLSTGSQFMPLSPERVLAENSGAVAFLDRYPVSEGHALVVPREVAVCLFDLAPEKQASVWELVAETRLVLNDRFHADGFNIGINDGEAAGQTVGHAHVHVIPRYKGDVVEPRGGIRWIFPDKARYW